MTGKQAAAIVARLAEKGYSREYVAARLGRTTSSFDKWASGVVKPRVATQRQLAALARKCGLEVGENGAAK